MKLRTLIVNDSRTQRNLLGKMVECHPKLDVETLAEYLDDLNELLKYHLQTHKNILL